MPLDNEGDTPPKRTTKISDAVRAELQRKWMRHISDLVIPVPLVMPPLRDIVHEINLIDPNLKHRYHPPRCPDALRKELVDKLVGRLFTIVTDHKALTFFKTKTHMSDRQVRWWEFLSRYQYKLVYTKRTTNKVADALSRYYMNDKPNEIQPVDDYVNVDARIDPQCDYLTDYRKHELVAGFPKVLRANAVRRST